MLIIVYNKRVTADVNTFVSRYMELINCVKS